MKKPQFKSLLCLISLFLASATYAADPLPLFTTLLKHSVAGGDPEKLLALKGVLKSSQGDHDTISLAKDPKFLGVTYWGNVRDGKIFEFHLAVHDRKDLFEKAQKITEEVLKVQFKDSGWKRIKNDMHDGRVKKLLIKKKQFSIELAFDDTMVGGRKFESVCVHLKPLDKD